MFNLCLFNEEFVYCQEESDYSWGSPQKSVEFYTL